ncbi:asparagine synthase-related protein [Peribacillus simplex]|uniref:asparagine synthase-related protein n=1 Tax=Peribacillus simplex TaxID=1478 RepID=UPI003D2DAE7A
MDIKRFWKPSFHPSNIEDSKVIKEIQETLLDSVNVHMRSDVPVGSFLSGGIDSSFICSIAKEINPKIKTFSVGFERDGYSEINVAQETAAALHVENISYIISPEEFLAELPKIIWHMDDPLADPAAVPLYFVAPEKLKSTSRSPCPVRGQMSYSVDIIFTGSPIPCACFPIYQHRSTKC